MSACVLRKFDNFVNKLFQISLPGHLRLFRYTLFAVLLHRNKKFVSKYGSKHIVVVAIWTCLKDFSYSRETFLGWCEKVKDHYIRRNAEASTESSGVLALIDAVHSQQTLMRKQVSCDFALF